MIKNFRVGKRFKPNDFKKKAVYSIDNDVVPNNGHKSATFRDFLRDGRGELPETRMKVMEELEEKIKLLQQLIVEVGNLDIRARNKSIFFAYNALGGYRKKQTFKQLSQCYGLTREAIRRIVKVIWEKLENQGFAISNKEQLKELRTSLEWLREMAEEINVAETPSSRMQEEPMRKTA